jgi:hypothetical protein
MPVFRDQIRALSLKVVVCSYTDSFNGKRVFRRNLQCTINGKIGTCIFLKGLKTQ